MRNAAVQHLAARAAHEQLRVSPPLRHLAETMGGRPLSLVQHQRCDVRLRSAKRSLTPLLTPMSRNISRLRCLAWPLTCGRALQTDRRSFLAGGPWVSSPTGPSASAQAHCSGPRFVTGVDPQLTARNRARLRFGAFTQLLTGLDQHGSDVAGRPRKGTPHAATSASPPAGPHGTI